jgi:hypothetical protein
MKMKLHINLPDDTDQETVVEIIGDITVAVLNRLVDLSLVSVERFPQDEDDEEEDESVSILDKFLDELDELDQVESEEEDYYYDDECKTPEGCLCEQCPNSGIEFGSTDVDKDKLLEYVFELKSLTEQLIKSLESHQRSHYER